MASRSPVQPMSRYCTKTPVHHEPPHQRPQSSVRRRTDQWTKALGTAAIIPGLYSKYVHVRCSKWLPIQPRTRQIINSSGFAWKPKSTRTLHVAVQSPMGIALPSGVARCHLHCHKHLSLGVHQGDPPPHRIEVAHHSHGHARSRRAQARQAQLASRATPLHSLQSSPQFRWPPASRL